MDKFSKKNIYFFSEDKVKIKAYINASLILVHPSRLKLFLIINNISLV